MPFRSQKKRSIKHIGHGGAHMPDEQRQNGEHECNSWQRHVEEQIAKFASEREAFKIERYHASCRKPATLHGNNQKTQRQSQIWNYHKRRSSHRKQAVG